MGIGLSEVRHGDWVRVEFCDRMDEAYRFFVEGDVWAKSNGDVGVGREIIARNGFADRLMIEIHDRRPAPQPYAEGTDRIEPKFGDVVEDEHKDWWIYLPRDTPNYDMTPWVPVEPHQELVVDPAQVSRQHRDSLSAELRLVRELRDVEGGDS